MTLDLKAIRAFVGDVDLILGDDDLRRDHGDVEIYLDTADVRGAALGMHAFYTRENTFNSAAFDHPRALIQALASRGHLGSFRLLPSHQAELLSLISVGFGLRREHWIDDLASQLWRDVGILPSDGGKPRSLKSLSRKDIKHVVEGQVGNADRFFKAVESIHGTWQSRLRDWRKKSLLDIARDRQDVADFANMDLFKEIKAELDDRRGDKPVNNFADAIALVSLMRKVDDFRAGRTRVFPCFFAATSLFDQVITKVKCDDRLVAALPGNRQARVLRNADYFKLRTVFNAKDVEEGKTKVLLTRDDLRKIHEQMRTILEAHELLTPEQVKEVGVSNEDLERLASSVRELSFCEHVWLPYRAEKDTRASILRYRATEVLLGREDKGLQGALEKVVTKVRADLQANDEAFKTLRAFWEQLPANCRSQSETLRVHSDTEEALFRRTGLMRFSLPQPVHSRIFSSITALIGKDDDLATAAVSEIIRTYWRVPENRSRSAAADAEHVAAVLWVAGMDRYILKVLDRTDWPHFSPYLMYSAAAIHGGQDIDKALGTFRKLEQLRAAERRSSRDRADIASGLAYLYYHLWNRSTKNYGTRRLAKAKLGLTEKSLIKKAVERAKEAYELLQKSPDDAKRVYTLNQMVYCMTLARTTELTALAAAADKLRKYREQRSDLWSYRYEETLAQYYLYLSETVKDQASIVGYLELAHERALDAYKEAPEDDEIRVTEEDVRAKLLAARAKLPTARSAAASGARPSASRA